MPFDPKMFASGLGGIGAGLGNMMSDYTNPADPAMGYMNQIPGKLSQYLNPYIQAGQRALPGLEGQYGKLMNDPADMLNNIGMGYHQSPGFQFALQQALQSAGNAASAGGMAGSPMHEQQNMGLATNLSNQDYNQWLQHALGMYNQGLQGQQGLYDVGSRTGISMGQDLASMLAAQAQLAYEAQNAQNQHEEGGMGSLMGGIGTLAGSIFGGPFGGAAGGAIGKGFGSIF